jgi:hypothetical protein
MGAHLTLCPSCQEAFHDLEMIVSVAAELRNEGCEAYPGEEVGWRRLEAAMLSTADLAVGRKARRRKALASSQRS